MTEVIDFATRARSKAQSREDVEYDNDYEAFKLRAIEKLEEAIAEVKAGRVNGMALAVRNHSKGERNMVWYDAMDYEGLYYTVGFLQHEMMRQED